MANRQQLDSDDLEVSHDDLVPWVENRFQLKLTRVTQGLTDPEIWQLVAHVDATWWTDEDADQRSDMSRTVVKEADTAVFEGHRQDDGRAGGRLLFVTWQTTPLTHAIFWKAKGRRLKALIADL